MKIQKLTGVGFGSVKFALDFIDDYDMDGTFIKLDNEIYVAFVDKNDGYRSYGKFTHADFTEIKTKYNMYDFPPQEVYVDAFYDEDTNGTRIYSATTNKLILEVITNYEFDPYYPVGQVHYYPQNLDVNIKLNN